MQLQAGPHDNILKPVGLCLRETRLHYTSDYMSGCVSACHCCLPSCSYNLHLPACSGTGIVDHFDLDVWAVPGLCSGSVHDFMMTSPEDSWYLAGLLTVARGMAAGMVQLHSRTPPIMHRD